ncbi:MAG: hypothetical protein HUJ76_11745, partial [Parasporobacterium sp.]|nr:hypothetical protein [Parasporobacterium sp.]
AIDWNKIKAEYIRGGTSYRKLAAKYGVSSSSLMQKGMVEKWTDLRKQKQIKAEAKIIEKSASREAERADNIQTVADLLIKKITEGITNGDLIVDSKDFRAITASLKDLREIKGYKSDLDMQEQMARIDKLRREAAGDTSDNRIAVVLSGCLEDYCE